MRGRYDPEEGPVLEFAHPALIEAEEGSDGVLIVAKRKGQLGDGHLVVRQR